MTDIKTEINDLADTLDADILAYFGSIIDRDDYIIDLCRNMKKRKNILLLLATRGGDPNAGYRIARCLQEAYNTIKSTEVYDPQQQNTNPGMFSVFVDGLCKSAGTLICLGADKLIMSGNAQLGPIDTQLIKRDEVGERESGLTPIQAVRFLETQSVIMFKRHFLQLRFSSDLAFSTKMSAEVAAELTVRSLAPIYSQIDPIRLAEVDRAVRIAREYGIRLDNKNLKEDAIDTLLGAYPSHAFVIDRKEAKKLFHNVDEPCKELRELGDICRVLASSRIDGQNEPFVHFLSDQKTQNSESNQAAEENDDG